MCIRLLLEQAHRDLNGTPAYPAYYLRRLYSTLLEASTPAALSRLIAQVLDLLGPEAAAVGQRLLTLVNRGQTLHERRVRLTTFLLHADRLGVLAVQPWGMVNATAIGSMPTEDSSNDFCSCQPWQRDLVDAARRVNVHIAFTPNGTSNSDVGTARPQRQPHLDGSVAIRMNVVDLPVLPGRLAAPGHD